MKENNFFARQTITQINSAKWEKIKAAYNQLNPDYNRIFENMANKTGNEDGLNLIRKLYEEFNENYFRSQ